MDSFESYIAAFCRGGPADEFRIFTALVDYQRAIFNEHCKVRLGNDDEIDLEAHKVVRYITPTFVLDIDDIGKDAALVGVSTMSLLKNTVVVPCTLPDLALPVYGKLRQLFHSTAETMARTINRASPLFMLEAATPYLKREAWNVHFCTWATCVLPRK